MAMMKEAASISALPSGERPGNNLLRLLRSSDYALIAPHLRPAELQANEVLYNPGDNIETVYFPGGGPRRRARCRNDHDRAGRRGRRDRQLGAASGLLPDHGPLWRPVRAAQRQLS